jgi:hypothetical protein
MESELMNQTAPARPARASGACLAPLNLNPSESARVAHDDTLRALLNEAFARQRDDRLQPAVRRWYRTASSVYWLEAHRRGIVHTQSGCEVSYI